jgi:hypothetical protein
MDGSKPIPENLIAGLRVDSWLFSDLAMWSPRD